MLDWRQSAYGRPAPEPAGTRTKFQEWTARCHPARGARTVRVSYMAAARFWMGIERNRL